MDHEGLRYNSGKLRYDLLPHLPIKELVKVLTKGAEKYAPRNWEKGLPWTDVIASLKRHVAAWEAGEDYDQETGCNHLAHAMCNAMFILEYYKTHPELDSRTHGYLKQRKIALDVGDVCLNFIDSYTEKFGLGSNPKFWHFDKHMKSRLNELKKDYEWWDSLPPMINPYELPFEPVGYVTFRPIPAEWTADTLYKLGFPAAPVISLSDGESKYDAIKSLGADVFVDDNYNTFLDLNRKGIVCYLMDRPHNKRYDVGYKRIHSLKELIY